MGAFKGFKAKVAAAGANHQASKQQRRTETGFRARKAARVTERNATRQAKAQAKVDKKQIKWQGKITKKGIGAENRQAMFGQVGEFLGNAVDAVVKVGSESGGFDALVNPGGTLTNLLNGNKFLPEANTPIFMAPQTAERIMAAPTDVRPSGNVEKEETKIDNMAETTKYAWGKQDNERFFPWVGRLFKDKTKEMVIGTVALVVIIIAAIPRKFNAIKRKFF